MSDARQRIYEAKQNALNRLLDSLLQAYQAVIGQQSHTLNDVDKVRLQRQADALNEQMDSIVEQLDTLEREHRQVAQNGFARDYNQLYLDLQSKLPKIDFKTLEPTLKKLLAYSEQGCAALLLLQNSYTMGGEWCTARIKVLLQDETSDFKHWPVAFDQSSRTDAFAVLEKLAGYMNLIQQQDQSLEEYAQAVIEAMMGSLQSGSIVFIELKKWEYLDPGPQVLDWFMEFWQAIVEALENVPEDVRQVKIFALIAAEIPLSEEYLKMEYKCSIDDPDKTKILEIPLEEWTHAEIKVWMEKYSGVRDGSRIDFIAEKIHRASQGIPHIIADMLLSECCPDAAH
ncbi:MAG: hypothetical protein R3F53_17975 [Gammaproteobacteria bacterium]